MATTATWFAGLLGAIFANGVSVETSGGLNFKAPFTVTPNEATGVLDIDVSLAGSPISQIQSEGVNVAQRTKLNFKGFTVTDDAGNDRTNVALTTSDPTSTGQIVTWSNALGKWVAGRTLTGSYSVIGDVSITSFLAVGSSISCGDIVVANLNGVYGQSSPAGTPRRMILLDASENMLVGTSGGAGPTAMFFDVETGGSYTLSIGGVNQLELTPSALDIKDNALLSTGFAALSGAGSYVAIGSGTAASVGGIRHVNTGSAYARGSGAFDIRIYQVLADDRVYFGDETNAADVVYRVKSTGSHVTQVGGATQLVVNDTTVDAQNNNIVTTGNVSIGASPPATGDLRLKYGFALNTKNNAGTDQTVIDVGVGGVDILRFGFGTADTQYFSATQHSLYVAGTARATVSTSALNLQNTNSNFAIQGNTIAMIGLNIAASNVRNLDLFGDGTADMNGGDRTIALRPCVVAPSGASSTTDTGQLFNDGGVLKWLGPDGGVYPLAGR